MSFEELIKEYPSAISLTLFCNVDSYSISSQDGECGVAKNEIEKVLYITAQAYNVFENFRLDIVCRLDGVSVWSESFIKSVVKNNNALVVSSDVYAFSDKSISIYNPVVKVIDIDFNMEFGY